MSVASRGRVRTLLHLLAASAVVTACDEPGRAGSPAAPISAALTQDAVSPTGQACVPTGKHVEHGARACATCHLCAGTLAFDATAAGANASFDAATKTCSSIACHAVPAGTFTYGSWDWSNDVPVETTVPYGGDALAAPVSWYAASGQGCGTCHGYPPTYGGGRYTWHSGTHAFGVTDGNACQLCHPDATGAYVYGGAPSYATTSAGLIATCAPGTYCSAPGTITNPSLHGNGAVDVSPAWRSTCFGCH